VNKDNKPEKETRTVIVDDLDALLDILPPHICELLRQQPDYEELIEIVMDWGRIPEARLFTREVVLGSSEIDEQDIEYAISRISPFTSDNRAGIERTLHRLSAIRNRQGRIIGLTCRAGRAVLGTVKLIEDLVQSGQNILLLGRPGVGKTTMLREVARVLADDINKRVIIVDTSNEIAGDGDIPHPAIGRARRMQVPTPAQQHAVMIEAVENHMPEAIIIDEIGTELEAAAARTIAERGVQLVGTAHGNSLDNLIVNPILCDLIGGFQTVILGDEEAQRRGSQKAVLERKAPPTFDVVVELQDFNSVIVHSDVSRAVDALLRRRPVTTEYRRLEDQDVKKEIRFPAQFDTAGSRPSVSSRPRPQRLYLFGVSHSKLEKLSREMRVPLNVTEDLSEAELVITLKSHYQRKPQVLLDAEVAGLPIYVLRSNAVAYLRQFLDTTYSDPEKTETLRLALGEAEQAAIDVMSGKDVVELSAQNSYVRRLQHMVAQRHNLSSASLGKDPHRRVMVFKDNGVDVGGLLQESYHSD